jgi:RluA family pseudouridine synthase
MVTALPSARVTAPLDSARLEKAVRTLFVDVGVGRSEAGRLIAMGGVRVDGRVVRLSSWEVFAGQVIEITAAIQTAPIVARDFGRWLISDDRTCGLIAVDKPHGLRSEPTRPGDEHNLQKIAEQHAGEKLHLVHRLDRDTSGVVVLARPSANRGELDAMFKRRLAEKTYRGVVVGSAPQLADEGDLKHRLDRDPERKDRMVTVSKGGDGAFTTYRVLARGSDQTFVELSPITGRTHQLRVQLAAVGCPIVGDQIYGTAERDQRLMLHATRLSLPLAIGPRTFNAPLPPGFIEP